MNDGGASVNGLRTAGASKAMPCSGSGEVKPVTEEGCYAVDVETSDLVKIRGTSPSRIFQSLSQLPAVNIPLDLDHPDTTARVER